MVAEQRSYCLANIRVSTGAAKRSALRTLGFSVGSRGSSERSGQAAPMAVQAKATSAGSAAAEEAQGARLGGDESCSDTSQLR